MIEECNRKISNKLEIENWLKNIIKYFYIDFKRTSLDWNLTAIEVNLLKGINELNEKNAEQIWKTAFNLIYPSDKKIPKVDL